MSVEDASGETRVNWDREVAAGNLVRKTSLVRDTSDKSVEHVQGRSISDSNRGDRVVSAHVMQHVAATGRYPSKPTGRAFVQGGWPTFGPDGSIIS